jgi:Bax protein
MPKTVAPAISFQMSAIGLVAAGVVGVYALALSDRNLPPLPESISGPAISGAAISGAAMTPKLLSAAMSDERSDRPAAVVQTSFVKSAEIHIVGSAGKLSQLFKRIGYELDGVRAKGEVPRLFIASLPHDLKKLSQPSHRKVMFIKSTLPLILHVNELIAHDRERLIDLRRKMHAGIPLPAEDRAWLSRMAERHDLDRIDIDELLLRVDVIPPSLAIAQAAEESGWGTSRFAREGNALFGQRIYDDERPGIVPDERDEGLTFRVRAFNHLIDGVKAYMRNLNTHFAYDKFREERARLRAEGAEIDGYRLVETLDRYSERGDAYIETIRKIMRINGLEVFDGARLGGRVGADEVSPDA